MSNLQFLDEAWEEFCHWLGEDKKTLKRILLKIILQEFLLEALKFY